MQRAVFDYQSGTGKSPADRSTFTICIDEFQKFATAGVEELVAEARKFGCGLVLAHQNLEQLFAFSRYEGGRSRELQDALLGNVGSVLAFRVGPQDVDTLSDLIRTPAQSFDQLPKFKALCRLTVDSDDTPCFTLTVDDASRNSGIKASADRLRERMIDEGYWISTEAAAEAAEHNVERFERVLEVGRDGAARAANQERAEMVAQLDGEGDDFYQAIEDSEFADAAVTVLPDLPAGLINHYVSVPASARQEMIDAAVAYLDGDSAEGSLVEAVRPLLPEGTDADNAAAFADGLASLDEAINGAEPQSLAELQQATVDWVLAGFLGSKLGKAARAEVARQLIPTGLREPGLSAVLSDYPADVGATIRVAVECYIGALAGSSLGRFLPSVQLPVFERRTAGPLDITETESVPPDYTDLGAVYLTFFPDGVRAAASDPDNGSFEQLSLESGESVLSLTLYAAPGGDLWPEIAAVVTGRLEANGTPVERLAGPYGVELRWAGYGEDGQQQQRMAGIDGPGWALQCIYAGPAAADLAEASLLDEMLRGVVVRGGLGRYARGTVIRMRLPTQAASTKAAPPPAQNGQAAIGQQAAAGSSDTEA